MKTIVIDASIVLKWYLDDEIHGNEALMLLHSFVANEINLVAPALLEYEVINGLIIAQRRGRIPEPTLAEAILAFQALDIKMEDISALGLRLLFYSKKYDRSAYDAAYLAIAEQVKAEFITADKALYNAVSKDLSWVKLIQA